MSNPPKLRPGRDITKMITAVVEAQHELIRDIQQVDAAIRRLPPGEDKRRLRAENDELKRQFGLIPEPAPSPRENWSSQQWEAKSFELKDAARKWRAAGRIAEAEKCLRDARTAEGEAARRRLADGKKT